MIKLMLKLIVLLALATVGVGMNLSDDPVVRFAGFIFVCTGCLGAIMAAIRWSIETGDAS